MSRHPLARFARTTFACLLSAAAAAPALAAAPDARFWLDAASSSLGGPLEAATVQAPRFVTRSDGACEVELALGARIVRLRLAPHALRGPSFRLLVQGSDGALREQVAPPPATWRGRVEDEPGSRVVASEVAGSWHLRVIAPGRDPDAPEAWAVVPLATIVPDAPAGLSLVCAEEQLPAAAGDCLTLPTGARRDAEAAAPRDLSLLSPAEVLVCEIACDADSEFHALNGSSVAATLADIEAVLNGVSDIYELDAQLALELGTVIVRAAGPDPYDTANPYALLTQMQAEWRSNQGAVSRDVAQLFTGRDLAGTPIGIAFATSVCYTYDSYSVVQSRYSTTMANRVALSAHELGHNFDAVHCDFAPPPCRIMCPSAGSCAHANHSFGPSEVSRIKAYVATRTCLSAGTFDPPRTTLPLSENFAAVNLSPARWTAVDNAYPAPGYLTLKHGGGYSGGEFDLGTARTLPIDLAGPAEISYKVWPQALAAGQVLRVEYFDSATRQWVLLQDVVAPGGTPGGYTTYAHTTPLAAQGGLFALRWSAVGSVGSSSTSWRLDDVSIVQSAVDVPDGTPGAGRWLSVSPNPASGPARIACRLPAAGRVALEVFDARGARVRTLARGTLAAGRHDVEWDGRDAHGRPLPSGVYVVRMTGPDGAVERRGLVLLR